MRVSTAASLSSRFDAEVVVRRAGDHDTDMIDGIVNASPVGMKSKPGMPIAAQHLDPRLWVADIVYFPRETELLRTARTLGCATLDGSGMVIRQAAAAFEIITGRVERHMQVSLWVRQRRADHATPRRTFGAAGPAGWGRVPRASRNARGEHPSCRVKKREK